MELVQLYALQQGSSGYAGYTELDLYASEPIKLSLSVQGLENPQATTSSFSKTFRVPHTSANGRFFEGAFNVNGVDFDATKKALAYIMVNGLTFTEGNIRLNQIYRNDATGKIEYEIMYLGETSTFGAIVGPKDLSTLDLSAYAHDLTYTAVTNSWNLNLFNGDIVYPLAEYGYTYTPSGGNEVPNQSTLSVYNGTTSTKGFTNSSNPLDPNQFRPMVRAKAIWDKIFEEAGFTYESTFLDTTFFKSLYMLSSNIASAVTIPSAALAANLVPQGFDYIATQPVPQLFPWSTPIYDYSNAYQQPFGYTVPYSGSPYQVQVRNILVDYAWAVFPTSNVSSFTLSVLVNGVVVSSQAAYLPTPSSSGGGPNIDTASRFPTTYNPLFTFNIPATAGDVITVGITVGTSSNFTLFPFNVQQAEWLVTGPPVVNPAGLLPVQYKQIEFIKAINDRFKLVWQPDPQNAKNFLIEPWKDWVLGGDQKDWTDKLDQSKDISITPLFYSQTRQIIYADSEEGDLYNFLYQQQNKETFGELKTDSGIELLTGEKTIKSLFSSTPLAPIGLSEEFLIPHFAKDSETKREPIQIKPRLLFYNGIVPAPINWYMKNGASSVLQTTYPLASSFDKYPFDNTSFDLNWTNPPQYWDEVEVGFNGRTAKTAYSEFWQTWEDFTYNPYSRIMEATFSLDVSDIQGLKFNDQIWVKDAWWLVQEIKEFVLNERQSCRVKLLKMGNFGYQQGGTGGQGKNYIQTGLCYSPTSACAACCCTDQTGVTIYSNSKFLSNSYQIFQDQNGFIFGATGYYSDGTNAYTVGEFGVIQSSSACSSCSCTPTGLTMLSNICEGPTLCNVCCCTSPEIGAIYVNGASIDLSTKAYSTTGGAPLNAGSWYRPTGSAYAAQMGPNGIDILAVGLCSSCNCKELPYVEVVSPSDDPVLACCPEYNGELKLWSQTGGTGATAFWMDQFEIEKYTPGTTGYISDGRDVEQITIGGTASFYGTCTPTLCNDRTETFYINVENSLPTNTEIEVAGLLSLDGTNTFYNGEFVSTGNTFDDQYEAYYPTNTYFGAEITVPGAYSGSYFYEIFWNGVPVETGIQESGYTTPTDLHGPLTTGDVFSITIQWNTA
jgi:hypothetical protein